MQNYVIILIWRPLLICRVNYVDSVTFPVLLPKMSQQKWREEFLKETCPRTTRWREVWLQRFGGRPENYINPGRFRRRENEKRWQRGFTEKMQSPLFCMHFSHLRLSLVLPKHTFQEMKKKKDADYVFIHQRCWHSLLYTTSDLK